MHFCKNKKRFVLGVIEFQILRGVWCRVVKCNNHAKTKLSCVKVKGFDKNMLFIANLTGMGIVDSFIR